MRQFKAWVAPRLRAIAASAQKYADAATEDAYRANLEARGAFGRLVYAATARCECGAGMAYDPLEQGSGPLNGPSQWNCGDIVRYETLPPDQQEIVKGRVHSPVLPFSFYEVKSENQPSANGRTTRPANPLLAS